MTDSHGQRMQPLFMQGDVIAGLHALAALRPASLALAPGFTVPEAKQAVETVARELGAVIEG